MKIRPPAPRCNLPGLGGELGSRDGNLEVCESLSWMDQRVRPDHPGWLVIEKGLPEKWIGLCWLPVGRFDHRNVLGKQ